jgi:hypothetical protein
VRLPVPGSLRPSRPSEARRTASCPCPALSCPWCALGCPLRNRSPSAFPLLAACIVSPQRPAWPAEQGAGIGRAGRAPGTNRSPAGGRSPGRRRMTHNPLRAASPEPGGRAASATKGGHHAHRPPPAPRPRAATRASPAGQPRPHQDRGRARAADLGDPCRPASARPVTSSRSAPRPAPTSPSSISDRRGRSRSCAAAIPPSVWSPRTRRPPHRRRAAPHPSARHPSLATPAHHQPVSQTCSHLVDVLAGIWLTGESRELPAMVGGAVVVSCAARGLIDQGANVGWCPRMARPLSSRAFCGCSLRG